MNRAEAHLDTVIDEVEMEINWLNWNQPYWSKAFNNELGALHSILFNLKDIKKELEEYRRPPIPVRDPLDFY